MRRASLAVVFGGAGFIGTHLTQHLLVNELADRILLLDCGAPRRASYAAVLQDSIRCGRVQFRRWDVRAPADQDLLALSPELIVNLAAVHREPGHRPREYYETNILGAENVCAYAAAVGCPYVVFTSSIAPYGPCECPADEDSLPVPDTPYGGSKLVAEKIHIAWQSGSEERRLLILRPGVVFGPGEGGNVTRLVRSVVRGYFVYMGNRETRKAGGYVKELCSVIQFGLEQLEAGRERLLTNFSMDPPPTLMDYVDAIAKVAGRERRPISVPRPVVMSAARCAESVCSLVRCEQVLNPARVRKLFRSTAIYPKRLRELGYSWRYSLEAALADWKNEFQEDFV